jgi:decaprenylphospho-beta-D-ribofuranose 2-oxidase
VNFSGWGNYPVVEAQEFAPGDSVAVVAAITGGAKGGSLIPRGLGRSYGDSSLAPRLLNTRNLDYFVDFDAESGVVTCAAGVSLATILAVFVPRGWFPPVTPGTKFVTVGGAIASDVHGKNHHLAGCFSDHVLAMKVATPAAGVVSCSPHDNAELFRATAGGMGLTGVILEATFRLQRINSAMLHETTLKARNLEEALALFAAHQGASYSVAWIDCLSSGNALGRCLLSLGEHAEEGELAVHRGTRLAVPVSMPALLLNQYSIKAFNALYYHRVQQRRQSRLCHYESFFYPLDGIAHWNRLYGRAGFVQYQFVLPLAAGPEGIRAVLSRIAHSRRGSFLAVLKLLGKENANLLSFPTSGYTLALDFKVAPGVFSLLEELDAIVLSHGGKLYLTKDARMSAATFRRCYPEWEKLVETRDRYGASALFNSNQSRRLEIS